jgi:uncharacterized protein YjeT (DUF2065 family)
MLEEFGAAIALLFIIEGIIPFLSPKLMRNLWQTLLQMDEKSIRISGLVSMVAGVAMLYWVK